MRWIQGIFRIWICFLSIHDKGVKANISFWGGGGGGQAEPGKNKAAVENNQVVCNPWMLCAGKDSRGGERPHNYANLYNLSITLTAFPLGSGWQDRLRAFNMNTW